MQDDLVKVRPPVTIQGRAVVRAQCTEAAVTRLVVRGVDEDGFICIELERDRSCSVAAPTERLGSVLGKKYSYEVFQADDQYRVDITGLRGKRVRFIKLDVLFHVFQRVPAGGLTFSKIRTECKQLTDSQHLKAALAILELRGLIACTRESKRAYYRRLKEWSLNMHK